MFRSKGKAHIVLIEEDDAHRQEIIDALDNVFEILSFVSTQDAFGYLDDKKAKRISCLIASLNKRNRAGGLLSLLQATRARYPDAICFVIKNDGDSLDSSFITAFKMDNVVVVERSMLAVALVARLKEILKD